MTPKDLIQMANKVRISLEFFDRELLLNELNEMQSFVERLHTVDISDSIEPFEHPLISEVRLRDDLVKESLAPAFILKNAPEKEKDTIVVPKIL